MQKFLRQFFPNYIMSKNITFIKKISKINVTFYKRVLNAIISKISQDIKIFYIGFIVISLETNNLFLCSVANSREVEEGIFFSISHC